MAKTKISAKNVVTEFWRDYRRDIYSVSRTWVTKARNLVLAFEAVRAISVDGSMHFDMRGEALRLAGMGIEVMLKALILENTDTRHLVLRFREPTTEAELSLRNTFNSHDLVALAAAGGVAFSSQHTEVADALSAYIYWRALHMMPSMKRIKNIIPTKYGNGPDGSPQSYVKCEQARELVDYVIAVVHPRLYNKR